MATHLLVVNREPKIGHALQEAPASEGFDVTLATGAVQERPELLVAILAGEPERAERLMREHVAGFAAAMRQVLA